MAESDTIAAIATPAGKGGVSIIRISGNDSPRIAGRIAGTLPATRLAGLRRFSDAAGDVLDEGLVLSFEAPASYTGEDVVELHCHGGPVVTAALLDAALAHGARRAEPGEFTRRAFVNGRLDLAQAQAVADLINATSQRAARAARRSLEGAFSVAVHGLVERLTELRLYVEAAIDFPEEEIDFLSDERLAARIRDVADRFDELSVQATTGRRLTDGVVVVIAGRPNAGKSSLLNALAGADCAIVTPEPGTTRDLNRETLSIDGVEFSFIDTAGLRESGEAIEEEGMRRAREALARADFALLVLDAAADDPEASASWRELEAELPPDLAFVRIANKADLTGRAIGRQATTAGELLSLSALDGSGIDTLRQYLLESAGVTGPADGDFTARARHLEAIAAAREQFSEGCEVLASSRAGELMAEHLRLAQMELGKITGEVTSDDLLGQIFGAFCIGK